jgi:hypothetical protein
MNWSLEHGINAQKLIPLGSEGEGIIGKVLDSDLAELPFNSKDCARVINSFCLLYVIIGYPTCYYSYFNGTKQCHS